MATKSDSSPVIGISGLGAVTSLGLDVVSACAAARAGIVRASELDVLNFMWDEEWGGEAVVGHAVRGIADGCVSIAKVLLLGERGLSDLLSRSPLSAAEMAGTGFHLNLSDRFIEDAAAEEAAGEDEAAAPPSGEWKKIASGVPADLLRRVGLAIPEKNQRVFFEGHTGIAVAVSEAIDRIQAGALDRCIIGGVECCFEPAFLGACARKALLKTAASAVGFMPGEAAAFFVLEAAQKARARRAAISVFMGRPSIVKGTAHRFSDEPPVGQALRQALRTCLSQAPPAERSMGFVLGDLNGDEYRAMEWGHALTHLNAEFGVGDRPLTLPALSFGETGAATGALSVCLATRAFERGYAPGDAALVWLLSESGSAAAMTLKRAAGLRD